MPAKDRYHDMVKRALIKDGWTVVKIMVRRRRDSGNGGIWAVVVWGISIAAGDERGVH